MRFQKRSVIAAIGMAVWLFTPFQATAQNIGGDFSRLQTVLKQNDKLKVTSEDGSKFEGRMLELAADRIVLQLKDGPRNITAAQVTKVQRQHNGVGLGIVIGAGAMTPIAVIAGNEGGGSGMALGMILVGAGIGAGVDAFIPSHRTVYDRYSKNHVSLSPVLDHRGRGVRVAVRF